MFFHTFCIYTQGPELCFYLAFLVPNLSSSESISSLLTKSCRLHSFISEGTPGLRLPQSLWKFVTASTTSKHSQCFKRATRNVRSIGDFKSKCGVLGYTMQGAVSHFLKVDNFSSISWEEAPQKWCFQSFQSCRALVGHITTSFGQPFCVLTQLILRTFWDMYLLYFLPQEVSSIRSPLGPSYELSVSMGSRSEEVS